MSDLVRRSGDEAVAVLTFNDPERRNAMSAAMGEAFAKHIAALSGEDPLRAVVITGEGRAFSAGGNLNMIGTQAQEGAANPDGSARASLRDTMRAFYGLFLSVRDLPCPVVAAVNGHAVGAGLCVALACDLRVVAREAKLALNFTRLGLHPGMGATWTLPRVIGPARAAELLYTGRLISGEEAERLGIANRAVPADQVLDEALALAREIAAAAPLAVRATRQALARSEQATLEEQLAFEAARQAECFETEDVREGLTAALERRDPHFRGR